MIKAHSLESFGARLRRRLLAEAGIDASLLQNLQAMPTEVAWEPSADDAGEDSFPEFNAWARELFSLQFTHNEAYRRFCENRGMSPAAIRDWREIPSVPASAFKELELSCIPEGQRTTVFFSSGTTEHRPSRHFHNQTSLETYEASVLAWFARQLVGRIFPVPNGNSAAPELEEPQPSFGQVVALTPGPRQAPHSSLAHMFETLRRRLAFKRFSFTGLSGTDGAWELDSSRTKESLQGAIDRQQPIMLLGTAFSYVHLLDHLAEGGLKFQLPQGSRVLETGGYKGRSRALPKSELHALITHRLGIPPAHIICEYGMSELSSQAYDQAAPPPGNTSQACSAKPRYFQFPPWTRVQIISPETGREVFEGETGLIRVFDLANVYSVMAVQTEDLAVRRRGGFELLGRAALAEARGCSLMALE